MVAAPVPEHAAGVEECTVAVAHSENTPARGSSGYLASGDQTGSLSLGLVEGTHSQS